MNMYAKGVLGFVVLFCYISVIKCELFTALVQLARVLQAEESLANDLKNYVQVERAKLDKIQAIADEYERHSIEAQKDTNHHLANPVNAYLLVKRLTTDWVKVQELIDSHNNSDFLKETVINKADIFPDERDLKGAGKALMRLQDVYSLNTEEIVTGNIKGVTDSPTLKADDCFELGKIAYYIDDFYHCVMWMDQALRSWESEDEKTIIQADVLDYLSFALYKQGNLHHAVNYTKIWLGLEPGHARAMTNLEFYQEEIAKHTAMYNQPPSEKIQNIRPRDEYQDSYIFRNYEKLCQGIETHIIKDAHKLHCYLKRDHPIFILAPVKLEVMHFDPWVAVAHGIVTESEIKKVKEIAQPKLHRSGVFVWEGGNDDLIQDYRTSKSAWLHDNDDPLIRRITIKAGALANLSISTVEELQVLNYGIGGHYEPHHDFARHGETGIFDQTVGNRIATVLFYMTDVEAGGATVFPRFGAKVFPEEGSCVLWYNLHRHGEGDYRTQHAGCPVLAGTKWICNKWFHERGQEFTRPCTLNSHE